MIDISCSRTRIKRKLGNLWPMHSCRGIVDMKVVCSTHKYIYWVHWLHLYAVFKLYHMCCSFWLGINSRLHIAHGIVGYHLRYAWCKISNQEMKTESNAQSMNNHMVDQNIRWISLQNKILYHFKIITYPVACVCLRGGHEQLEKTIEAGFVVTTTYVVALYFYTC